MPHVDDQDDARLARVVPHLVLEGVVQDEHRALAPRARLAADADRAAGLRHPEPELEPQPVVARAAVRQDVRARRQHAQEGVAGRPRDRVHEPRRERRLRALRRRVAPLEAQVVDAPVAILVEQRVVVIAVLLEPPGAERGRLVANERRVALEQRDRVGDARRVVEGTRRQAGEEQRAVVVPVAERRRAPPLRLRLRARVHARPVAVAREQSRLEQAGVEADGGGVHRQRGLCGLQSTQLVAQRLGRGRSAHCQRWTCGFHLQLTKLAIQLRCGRSADN